MDELVAFLANFLEQQRADVWDSDQYFCKGFLLRGMVKDRRYAHLAGGVDDIENRAYGILAVEPYNFYMHK